MSCSMSGLLLLKSACVMVIGENLFRYFSIPRNDCSSFFVFSDSMPVSFMNSAWVGLTVCHCTISLKKAMPVHLNRHLSSLGFRFNCVYIHSTFSSISSWSHPCLYIPAIKMSSAMLDIWPVTEYFIYFLLELIFSQGCSKQLYYVLIPAKQTQKC